MRSPRESADAGAMGEDGWAVGLTMCRGEPSSRTLAGAALGSNDWIRMEPLPRFFPLDRLVAFSDGVFAVVITILVLGIEVPADVASDAAGLAEARDKLVHQLLAYMVAFALVAMYWTQHGMLYAGVRSADRRLVVLNLLFLIPVTLLPFVTQVMGARRR